MSQTVPHSIGINKPMITLPDNACDCHMHIFDRRFKPSPHMKKEPPEADVSMYQMLQQRLGIKRTVVVNPSTYGVDNACTLDALRQLGDQARGVAVVDSNVTTNELVELDKQYVRGLRVNFVTPQSWGETTGDMLKTLAYKVAPLGWHIQIFVHPEQLVSLKSMIASLPVPIVVDHMARINPNKAIESEAFQVLKRLIDRGNTWVKLSGAYMRSVDGEPFYEDIRSLASSLVKAAPDRLVWGSDWPHTTQPRNSVNDANLLDALSVWCDGVDTFNKILVKNPEVLYGF